MQWWWQHAGGFDARAVGRCAVSSICKASRTFERTASRAFERKARVMGALRLLLALAVVLDHAGPLGGLRMTGGLVAVETFFVISGFYMALVLNRKYVGPGDTAKFYVNRFLRIFPAYWLVQLATLGATFVGMVALASPSTLTRFVEHWPTLEGTTRVFLVATNVLLFGQDWADFFAIGAHGELAFAEHLAQAPLPAYEFMFTPQAWSLGTELTFYVVAPFIVRRRWPVIAGVAAGSVLLRALLYQRLGLFDDPWNLRFFPVELGMFLAGVLAYKYYEAHAAAFREARFGRWPRLATATVIAAVVGFQFVPSVGEWLHFDVRTWLFYGLVAVSIPFVFECTRRSAIDRWIGELSYPVYLSHLLVMRLLKPLGLTGALPAILGTLIVSVLLVRYVIERIERARERVVEAAPAPASGGPAGLLPGIVAAVQRTSL